MDQEMDPGWITIEGVPGLNWTGSGCRSGLEPRLL